MTQTEQNFDSFGRCLPTGVDYPAHKETRRYFICEQPEIEYDAIYNRIAKNLGVAEGFTSSDFRERAETIIDNLKNDPETANITKGVYVPFFIPKNTEIEDIGKTIEENFMGPVTAAYKEFYPEYEFVNHFKGTLKGQVKVAEGSRHDQLIEKLKNETVVGVYFPCMTEYSVPAAIAKVKDLPEKFLLSGGVDLFAAMIGSPALLMRKEGYSPLLWCTALETDKQDVGFHFEAYGYNLNFNRRVHLNQAAEYWWSGLTVLG